MLNWSETMTQTFEYYKVDPMSWSDTEPITTIIDSRLERDNGAETLGSASFTSSELLGECYIRVYLIAIQNEVKYKIPLGTYLVQTPSFTYDGKVKNVSIDAYTPLIELKEKLPPIGYFIPKDRNVLDEVYNHISRYLRAPVVKTKGNDTIPYDFVADTNDTWMSYVIDLVSLANHYINIDDMGRIIFEPKQLPNALAPKWIYNDDNSSILHPAVSLDNDLYGVPNVVEVVYSTGEYFFHVRVENNEEDSPISIKNRGREIVHRITNPEISGTPDETKIRRYAENTLKQMSSLEYTIVYTHGYCPVSVGDCVMLNYKRAGLNNIKATIISQSISCVPGAPVEEKAVFTSNLWR